MPRGREPDTSIVGQRFGRLTVVAYSHTKKYATYSRPFWLCRCDCGNQTSASTAQLRSGNTRSCGCLAAEYKKQKHGYRTPSGHRTLENLFGNYQSSAKSRGLEFGLTLSDFRYLIDQNCFYCGIAPSAFYRNKPYRDDGALAYNGLDRVDNALGYTKENVVPCCKVCNRAKSNMPYPEFIDWIDNMGSNTINLRGGHVAVLYSLR